tara:strand:- start:1581 stop:1964 length:384 start_codon:yes stop_codon:yes gene_type:complete
MALEQKYIEVRSRYDFDDWFVAELATCPHQAVNEIINQLEDITIGLPSLDGWTQQVCGVVKVNKKNNLKEPFFFTLEYLKQHDEIPVYLDIQSISCDEYLDCVIKKNHIKLNKNYGSLNKSTSKQKN